MTNIWSLKNNLRKCGKKRKELLEGNKRDNIKIVRSIELAQANLRDKIYKLREKKK